MFPPHWGSLAPRSQAPGLILTLFYILASLALYMLCPPRDIRAPYRPVEDQDAGKAVTLRIGCIGLSL